MRREVSLLQTWRMQVWWGHSELGKCPGALDGNAHSCQPSPPLWDAKRRRPRVIKMTETKPEYLRKDLRYTWNSVPWNNSWFLWHIGKLNFQVKHGALKTYASLTTLPFLSTIVAYKLLVSAVLYSGNRSKGNCVLRSSLIGIVWGVLYPHGLAFSKNGHLAVRYHTVLRAIQRKGFTSLCCCVKQRWKQW